MNRIEFKFCSLQENLSSLVFQQVPLEKTVFVFPTENNKRAARSLLLKDWAFSDTALYTMDELKHNILISERPLLKEEKRTLVFYQALSREDKAFFSIHHYFHCIDLAHVFFALFQEWNEENVDEHLDARLFEQGGAELLPWQELTYQRLLAIKAQYKSLLDQKGFNDSIFVQKKENYDATILDDYERIVFVNQFYYTELEKSIIRLLVEGKQVTIFYQCPESLVDRETLEVKPFQVADLGPFRTQKIKIFETADDFTALMTVLDHARSEEIATLVDLGNVTSMEAFLSLQKFKRSSGKRFFMTSIDRFLSAIYECLENLHWHAQRKKWLLPLHTLYRAVQTEELFRVLATRANVDVQTSREEFLSAIRGLMDQDFKYIDLEKEFFDLPSVRLSRDTQAMMHELILFIRESSSLASIGELVDRKEFFHVRDIVSGDELLYSDILDIFYRLLTDFLAIEDLALVEEWADIFAATNPMTAQVRTAAGILRLFLDYMKAKTIRYSYRSFPEGRISISDLLDTRNMYYPSVAVLNVIEGKLPRARQVPFLFSEQQRKILNLKTFDDIKLREKYYFFRLVLSTPRVVLFTQKNVEKNIDKSSFLEELLLGFPQTEIEMVPSRAFRRFYHTWLSAPAGDLPTLRQPFFCLPLDVGRDFPDGALTLSYYAYKELRENAFAFFIRQVAGIQEPRNQAEEDFSYKLTGTLIHDILNQCWKYLLEETAYPLFDIDFSAIDISLIRRAISFVLEKQPETFFKIPQNYHRLYFHQVMVPVLEKDIVEFFRLLNLISSGAKKLHIYPENERGTREERQYKTIIDTAESPITIPVKIRGRADLRIEDPEKNRYMIFDYKTGSFDQDQLILYELFYYRLNSVNPFAVILSYFINFLGKGTSQELGELNRNKPDKESLVEEFLFTLGKCLESLAENGYVLPPQKGLRAKLADITRSDLAPAE